MASPNLVCRQPLEKPEIDLDEFVDCDRRAHGASDNARAFARPLERACEDRREACEPRVRC